MATAIRGKVLPMAMYAVSTSHVPLGARRSLQSACADALVGDKGKHRSPSLALAFAGMGTTTVDGEIAMTRILTMRRIVAKRPHLYDLLLSNIK